MRYRDYLQNYAIKKSALRLPIGTHQMGGLKCKSSPNVPPWLLDWAIVFPTHTHIRVTEYFVPQAHPNHGLAIRKHFCYHYGPTTDVDHKAMPETKDNAQTIIRIDQDRFGPHIHYKGQDHVEQNRIAGNFIIQEAEVFEFIEAIRKHQESGASFEELLSFTLNDGGTNE